MPPFEPPQSGDRQKHDIYKKHEGDHAYRKDAVHIRLAVPSRSPHFMLNPCAVDLTEDGCYCQMTERQAPQRRIARHAVNERGKYQPQSNAGKTGWKDLKHFKAAGLGWKIVAIRRSAEGELIAEKEILKFQKRMPLKNGNLEF